MTRGWWHGCAGRAFPGEDAVQDEIEAVRAEAGHKLDDAG
jgi:hypothetical protein